MIMVDSKWVLLIPQKLLTGVNLWPTSSGRWRKITFFAMLTLLISIETGQLCYLIKNIKDITAMAATMSTISTTFQAIFKSSILFTNSENLKEVLTTIDKQFWSTSMVNQQVKDRLKFNGRLVVSNMLMVLVSAAIFGIGFLSKPLREGLRELPLISLYPFDWKITPLYEILYVLQCFADFYVVINSVCGLDDLFLAICLNCMEQFIILKEVLIKTTRGNLKSICEKRSVKDDLRDKKMYFKCIEHHTLLLRLYNNIERIFSLNNFVQLLCSGIAICVSSLLIVTSKKAQVVDLSSYCLGHILQLFLYCSAASELSYESQDLANFPFGSEWYRKKDMIMVLMMAQKPKRLSAFGILEMNYATFLSVLKLSFSFYTLLSKMVAK